MSGILDLAMLILDELRRGIFDILFWVVLGLVALQYRRIARTRESLFGIRGNTVLKDTATATLYGIIGGTAGSFLLVLTGINVMGLGIGYVWPLALLLLLINPRFLCFSYAGGIVALSNLLLGVPEVDIPQLMGLVAILHLIESILIYFSGHIGATPMFTKKPSGQIVGGFTLQKFWPLPIVAIALLPDPTGLTLLPSMPGWWPVIKIGEGFSFGLEAALLPFVAGLGYGDLAIAHTPVEKSKMSARNLSIYSFILIAFSMLASHYRVFAYLAVVFAPLGHEAVIFMGQNTELKGKPVFIPPLRGVRVLEAVPNNAAQTAGIRSGDIIYTINGNDINSKRDIEAIMYEHPALAEIEYITHAGRKWQRSVVRLKPYQSLGIIAVPEGYETMYTEFKDRNIITRIIGRLCKRQGL